MSIDPTDPLGGTPADVATLLAEADGAAAQPAHERGAAIRDLLIPDARSSARSVPTSTISRSAA